MNFVDRIILFFLFILPALSPGTAFGQAPVNLSHLDFMKEDRVGMSTVWLYSDYPKYERQRDTGEGAACLDDNARAVVTYCRYFEATGDTNALVKAKNICEFVRYMRYDNSPTYVNFIWENGDRNETGPTSAPSFGSYASRACWALGQAYKTFLAAGGSFSSYATGTLNAYIDQFNVRLHGWDYATTRNIHGYTVINMPFDNAHNAAAALMGLIAWHEAGGGGTWVNDNIQNACNNIVAWQFGNINTFPFYGILTKIDNVTWFQGYGAYHVAALAYAAGAYTNNTWLQAAKNAADYFYSIYLTSVYPGHEGRNPGINGFPQIAFAIAPMVEGCYRIYRASRQMGEAPSVYLKYAKYAGLFASYFMGNNIYGVPMYDPNTGICFDGIESPENPLDSRVNRNSGGESTVETLNALLLVLTDTNCTPYVNAREYDRQSALILEAESADEIVNGSVQSGEWFGDFVSGQMFSGSKYVQLAAGGSLLKVFYTENHFNDLSDNYLIYLCYAKRTAANADTILVTVDDVHLPFNTGSSPDSDFIFFEKLTNSGAASVFSLPPGRHTLQITAGSKPLILDQVVVQPVVQRKSFKLADGSLVDVDRSFLASGSASSAPGGLAVTPIHYGNTLRLDWVPGNSVFGYNVYRKADTETVFSKINIRPLNRTYFIDNGLLAGESYSYRITSISNSMWQESVQSLLVSGTVMGPQTVEMKLTETENDWSVSKSGIYLSSTIYNGFAETRAFNMDVDQYPDITVAINNPSDTYWSFSVLRWIDQGAQFYTFEEVPLQDKTRDTGRFNYNLKSLFGWTGRQFLKFRFYLSRNNLTTFLNEIRINNKATGQVSDILSSPQLFFSTDGITPGYYLPDMNLTVDPSGEKIVYSGNVSLDNLDLSLSKTVSADFSYYKSVSLRINTQNEWALECVVNDETVTLSPFTTKSGTFFFNLAESTGGLLNALQDMLLRFRIRTSGAVNFEIDQLKLSSSPVPFFSSYEGVRAVPNPFTPASSDSRFNRIIFYFDQEYGTTGNVRVYTLDGRLVREVKDAVSGQAFWDGKDDKGKMVPSGLYLFQVTTEGKKIQTGSMVVIK